MYKNAPLVEAVFEIRFSGELSIECHRDLFYEKIREKYPSVYVPEIKTGAAPSLIPYRFMDENNISGFFVSMNSLAFSTKNYKGFNDFKHIILKYFKIFSKIYKINKIERIGLRYIFIA